MGFICIVYSNTSRWFTVVGCNIMPQQKKTQSDRLEKLHQDPVESRLISNGGPCGTEERLVVDPFPETNQCRMSSFNPCNFKVDTETEFHRKGRSKKTKSNENVDPDDAKRHCFICNESNDINPERAKEVARAMQIKLDGKVPSAKLEKKLQVKPLSTLRKGASEVKDVTIQAAKLFNRLVIFAQREQNKLEESLKFELSPVPLSLFGEDQRMHTANKALLGQHLKAKSPVLESSTNNVLVVDGGWLLHYVSWPATKKKQSWTSVLNAYVNFVKWLGNRPGHVKEKVVVVFDGYQKSTKDHTHRKRSGKVCPDIKIKLTGIPLTTKVKFLTNPSNKTELIDHLSSALIAQGIVTVKCDNDADTIIASQVFENAETNTVEVRVEDMDILGLLTHHYDETKHKSIHFTSDKNTYAIHNIQASFEENHRAYLLVCHAFSGCDTTSSAGHGKVKLLNLMCAGNLNSELDVFINPESTHNEIKVATINIFKSIYREDSPLHEIRFNRFCKQAKTGSLRPEALLPTEDSAYYHGLRVFKFKIGFN